MMAQQLLKEILDYDPNTGEFRWKVNKGTRAIAGSIAGNININGYRVIWIDRKLYKAHRLAWLYHYGTHPIDQIDHKNGIRADNGIDNLRQVTNQQNQQNVKRRKHNTSGITGVHWDTKSKKWRAKIMHKNKSINLGLYDDINEAAKVRKAAEAKYQPLRVVAN